MAHLCYGDPHVSRFTVHTQQRLVELASVELTEETLQQQHVVRW